MTKGDKVHKTSRKAKQEKKAAMTPQLRIARPVSDLAKASDRYRRGLGLSILGGFEDHDGFDGVILGIPGASYHFELTRCRAHPVAPAPTAEDLAVLYLPAPDEWKAACARMLAAGFRRVASFNPYWETRGRTYEDADGYRIVLEHAEWSATSSGAAPASAPAS
ncbi:MAG TPA: VOC family protein [Burkholderiales bacterium]|nr:VOC family protein [Burkholderiales bacterium]